MLSAVDFDDEFLLEAYEVADVMLERHLSATT